MNVSKVLKMTNMCALAGVRGINTETDVTAGVAGIGTVAAAGLGESKWVEYGARLGYRVSDSVTIDAFTNGISGGDDIGTRVHGGADIRIRFSWPAPPPVSAT